MKLIEFNIEEFPNVVFVVSVTFLFLWTLELSTDWFCSPIIAIIISLFFAMHPQMRQQRNRYFHKLAHESKTGDQMMKSGVGHFKKTIIHHIIVQCVIVWHLNECFISMCKNRMSFYQQQFARSQCSLCSRFFFVLVELISWHIHEEINILCRYQIFFMNVHVLWKLSRHFWILFNAISRNTVSLWFQCWTEWMRTIEFCKKYISILSK